MPELRVEGRRFVDPVGRVVVLRGVNLSGGAKVPPFAPVRDASDLDVLPAHGFNLIRLLFTWEAYEPVPGAYDEGYLARLHEVAAAAWARGLYVVVDVHQDGFSRFASRGSGDGFPRWALSPRARPATPDNSERSKRWPILMATDPNMHRSFADFYADTRGVRTRYLAMLGRLAAAMANIPGVIGYDPLNEPWGDERDDLGPLYRDAAAVLRAAHPSAILFIEGHISTNSGLQTRLERPAFGNFVYAPHYYHPATILTKSWRGPSWALDRAFRRMNATAEAWDVPLFLGEFGAPADATRASAYVGALYDRLDRSLASGAQWNVSPNWNVRDKDGWNGEDFHVLNPDGTPRPNLPPRPHPRAIAGEPIAFLHLARTAPHGAPSFEMAWQHDPARGATEVYVPARLFPPGSTFEASAPDVSLIHDSSRQRLFVRQPRVGVVRLRGTGAASPRRRRRRRWNCD